jgi:hypothetical protein
VHDLGDEPGLLLYRVELERSNDMRFLFARYSVGALSRAISFYVVSPLLRISSTHFSAPLL